MCQFKSAVVTKSGKVYHHDLTDSHSEIQTLYNLKDRGDDIACVEFVPTGGHDQLDKYELKLDGDRVPSWWDEIKGGVEQKLRAIVAGYIKTQDVRLSIGTTLIARDRNLGEVRHCRVFLYGSSTVWAFLSSTVTAYDSSTVRAYDSSTATAYGSSTVTDKRKAKV